MEIETKALELKLSDQGQMFAGVATIRAAIADVLGVGDPASSGEWLFFDTEEDWQTERRIGFMDAVIKRIAELQSPPFEGIKLENLCPRHRREALPAPTAKVCGMCQVERGK